MTDMRNFEPSNDIRAESAFVDSNVLDNQAITAKESYVLEDSGGLGEFHREEVEEEGSGRGKVISGLIVALMLGAAGAYAYSMWTPQPQAVADESPAPKPVAAMTPPPAAIPAPAEANTAPTAPDVVKPAPVTKQANIGNAPRVARAPVFDQPAAPMMPAPTVAPPQNQAAAVPEPVSPTPPASALAGNPPLNEQTAAPAETPVTPIAPTEAAPAAPAEPAPAQ